jgi:hypothetical protein
VVAGRQTATTRLTTRRYRSGTKSTAVRLFKLVVIASYIVEDELTMKKIRLEKIKKPTKAASPLARVPEHRLVRQPTNNDKLSATFSRRYRCESMVEPFRSNSKVPCNSSCYNRLPSIRGKRWRRFRRGS